MSDICTPVMNEVRQSYQQEVRKKLWVLLGLVMALVLSLLFDLSTGPIALSFRDILGVLLNPEQASTQLKVVLLDIRMPVALMAVVTGACLSLAGAQMQTVLNNPLASPFTLGISAAASFGAALALAFGVGILPWLSTYMVSVNAFLMAMLSALLIYFLSLKRGVSTETMVLLGIALVFSFNALLALIQYFASEEAIAAVVFWTMGSLTKTSWEKLAVTSLVFVLCLPFFIRSAWAMTALRMGDLKANSFGVNVARLRLQTLLVVSLLAAIPVSFVGTIGFVGLAGPHMARMLIGEDQRFFMPAAILSGALLLSLSSAISKLLIPGTIFPIGIVTSLVGIPFFIALIMSRRGQV